MYSENFGRRFAMSLAGVIICSGAVGMLQHSGFGVDPFQCFTMGVWGRFVPGMSYGLFWPLVSLLFLAFDLWYDRHNIGAATFVNLFLAGYVVDASRQLCAWAVPAPGLIGRIGFMAVGLVVVCLGASLYMTADLGVSVYDALAISISKKHPIPFRFCRILTDLVCVSVGALCGKMPGVGTLLTALCMGPLIDAFNRHVSEPLLRARFRRRSVRAA